MSKQSTRKPLSIVLGAAAVVSLSASAIASATPTTDIFAMDELTSGYLTAGGHEKEGSCGGDKDGEGSCGEDKGGEGSCGEDKGADKGGEGKCGEGKCGSS
jgi:uncharacterized low-complexity protein